MPSSATITAFVTAVAGTKARASHFNTNFSNYRGHILPVDPNTIASSHQTYDLGASDAQWRRIYLKEPPYVNGSQLGRIEIETLYDGSVPCNVVDDIAWMGRVAFQNDTDTSSRFQFTVPPDYTIGNRISVGVRGYAEDGGKHITMETMSALYRGGLDDASLTSPANILTSTTSLLPNTSTAGRLISNTTLRLTDATGKINSLTVSAGDVIAVDIKRRGLHTDDTNTGYFYLTNLYVDLNN